MSLNDRASHTASTKSDSSSHKLRFTGNSIPNPIHYVIEFGSWFDTFGTVSHKEICISLKKDLCLSPGTNDDD